MEIGVYKGNTSSMMIAAAMEHNDSVEYYGFDLFGSASSDVLLSEVSQRPMSVLDAQELLRPLGAQVTLFEGKTTKTLPTFLAMNIKPDFIFIDGGHSPETIEHDWSVVKKLMHEDTAVYFDDYVETDSGEDLGWGCKYLISKLQTDPDYSVRHLPAAQRFDLRRRGTAKWNVPGTLEIVKVQYARVLQPTNSFSPIS